MQKAQQIAEQEATALCEEILQRVKSIEKDLLKFDQLNMMKSQELAELRWLFGPLIKKFLRLCFVHAWKAEAADLAALYGAALPAEFLARVRQIQAYGAGADLELHRLANEYAAKRPAPDEPLPVPVLRRGTITVNPVPAVDFIDYTVAKNILLFIQQIEDIKRSDVPEKEKRKLIKWRTGEKGDSGLGYRLTSIVRSEFDTAQAQACADVYETAGVEGYRFNAMLDDKTCDVCRALHGKIFRLTEIEQGVNFPLIHPNCRCYVEPVLIMK